MVPTNDCDTITVKVKGWPPPRDVTQVIQDVGARHDGETPTTHPLPTLPTVSSPPPHRSGPRLQDRSVFDGLDRRSVGYGDLVAHSVAVICPSASALSTAFSLHRVVGPGAWLSVLIGVGLCWVLAAAFGEFASRFTATGSLYTYAAKGLGPTAGLVVGCALLLGYLSLVDYGLADASNQVGRAAVAFGGAQPSAPVLALLVVLGAGVCLLVLWRGIRWSSRFAFSAEAVALATLLVVLATIAARHGVDLPAALSLEGAEPGRVLRGAAMVMTVVIGFESCAALAVEAEQPFRSVPRAMRTSVLITGGLLLGSTLVAGPIADHRLRGRWFAPGEVVSFPDGLVLLAIALSYVALAVCAWTALSRLVFAFAREGILPAVLGRTGRRSAIPGAALVATLPVVLAPPLVALARGDAPGAASYDMLVWATVILMTAYGITALAVVPFTHRLGEFTARTTTLACTGVVGTAVLTWVDLRTNFAQGDHDVLTVLAAVAVAGLCWRAVLARRDAVSGIGLHEAPLRSEVLVPGEPPGGEQRG